MKKLLIILLLLPLASFGQQKQAQAVVNKISVDNTSVVQRALVTTEPTTKIVVPLEVDFNNYTHLAMVDFKSIGTTKPKKLYKLYEERLSSTPLILLNPFEVDKNKAKKDKTFLKRIKDPKYLYLYYFRSQGSGNDNIGTRVIVRDYKNKILYSANHTNVDMGEILYPFIGF